MLRRATGAWRIRVLVHRPPGCVHIFERDRLVSRALRLRRVRVARGALHRRGAGSEHGARLGRQARVRSRIGRERRTTAGRVRVLDLPRDGRLGRVVVCSGTRLIRVHLRGERDGVVRCRGRASRRERVVVTRPLRCRMSLGRLAEGALALVPEARATFGVKLLVQRHCLAFARRLSAHLVLQWRRYARRSAEGGAGRSVSSQRRRGTRRVRNQPSRDGRDGRRCLELLVLGR